MIDPNNAFPPAARLPPRPGRGPGVRRLRRRLLATVLRQTFARARFRVSLVVTLTGVLWGGMFWMFYDGFQFLQSTGQEIYADSVHGLFGAFLLALMLMLMVSSGLILYGSLFRSRETAFLLTLPARTGRVFLHKFQEAVVLSSWGFVLLASPMLLAYGAVAEAPWYYYVLLPPLVFAFIYIPVAIGAILCLVVVRVIRENPLAVLIGLGLFLAAGAAWMGWGLWNRPRNDLLTPAWFQEVLGRLKISDHRLLPSWWLTTAVLDVANRETLAEGTLFLALMISNALFFRQLALWTAGRVFRAAYSGLYGRTIRHRRLAARAVRPPAGLALAAVAHRRPAADDQGPAALPPRPLAVVASPHLRGLSRGLLLEHPQLHLRRLRRLVHRLGEHGQLPEPFGGGAAAVDLHHPVRLPRDQPRRPAVLDSRPTGVRRQTILWAKFLFAAAGTLLPCSGLVLMSDLTLHVRTPVLLSHQLTCLVLCLGLAGIAVGLGAWLPNLREESPARIAAGFGGTLTLVLSTLYILFVVLLTALPTHFYLAAQNATLVQSSRGWASVRWWLAFWLVAGTAGSLLLGAAATVIPLCIGFRAFRRLEF